ncbi:MAG: hypothetical protein IPM46_15740 [Flavobacteriales bacterium]|nr:hypothetical protein [Flavobacteriales bacterium]
MTARGGLVLVLFGILATLVSVIFKFQDWPGAGILFLASNIPTLAGLAVLCWKIMRYPGLKDFLDR